VDSNDVIFCAWQPCPIPNGAAGLALLGKICRKSSRKERAKTYFRMSLQLDPFLFTSFQALAELGEVDLDAASIFGGAVGAFSANHLPQPLVASETTLSMKTPLQAVELPLLATAPRHGRALMETPGLTPISRNNESLPGYHHTQSTPASALAMNTTQENPAIVRRARQVAARHYYPPSPDTPLTSVTRSMRYLRGLGTHEGGRSLFLATSSENQASNPGNSTVASELTGIPAVDGVTSSKPDKENNENVQDILDLLTVAGAAYHNLCRYRCKEALNLLQQLPISQQRTSWVLHQQGRAFLEKGDFLSAQRSLEFMHALDPGRMQGLELLSTVYWQLKKEIDLANLAQRAMDWDFTAPQAHCVAGNCFSLQKDHETALVFFKRSLQLDSDFTYTHTLSGYEYMSNEDFDKAFACFRQALKLDDRHYNAWYGLGAIYHRQEKFDLAEYHFERAVLIHPTSSVLRCNLGMAQHANGKAYVALETLPRSTPLSIGQRKPWPS
jgi:anaphase-promoting complex subunit 3